MGRGTHPAARLPWQSVLPLSATPPPLASLPRCVICHTRERGKGNQNHPPLCYNKHVPPPPIFQCVRRKKHPTFSKKLPQMLLSAHSLFDPRYSYKQHFQVMYRVIPYNGLLSGYESITETSSDFGNSSSYLPRYDLQLLLTRSPMLDGCRKGGHLVKYWKKPGPCGQWPIRWTGTYGGWTWPSCDSNKESWNIYQLTSGLQASHAYMDG